MQHDLRAILVVISARQRDTFQGKAGACELMLRRCSPATGCVCNAYVRSSSEGIQILQRPGYLLVRPLGFHMGSEEAQVDVHDGCRYRAVIDQSVVAAYVSENAGVSHTSILFPGVSNNHRAERRANRVSVHRIVD